MFRRILLILLVLGLVGGVFFWLRRNAKSPRSRGGARWQGARGGRRSPPAIPESWSRLAAQDAHLGEALRIRESLVGLVGRGDSSVDTDLVREVDELLICVVDLVELRVETEERLGLVEDGVVDLDAARSGAGRLDGERLAKLRARPNELNREVERAVGDLRDTFVDVIDNVAAPSHGARHLIERTRTKAAELRRRVVAERELRSILHGLPDVPTDDL